MQTGVLLVSNADIVGRPSSWIRDSERRDIQIPPLFGPTKSETDIGSYSRGVYVSTRLTYNHAVPAQVVLGPARSAEERKHAGVCLFPV